jgi:hypothetical protein
MVPGTLIPFGGIPRISADSGNSGILGPAKSESGTPEYAT